MDYRYPLVCLCSQSITLKRSLPLDSQEGGPLPPHFSAHHPHHPHQTAFDETDYIFMQSKKMLTAAALGAGSSASAGATTPSSLCSTPVSLFQQSALLPYAATAASTLAASAAVQPFYQQMIMQQSLSGAGGLTGGLAGAGMGMMGGGGGTGSASYEGIPIFIVPGTGATPGATTVSLAALQKAAEIKATLLANALTEPKVDTSKHHHIFVGDLSPEVTNTMLKDAFAPYGEISEAKVIRDSQTQKSKGYGFVSYPIKEHAEKAMTAMNGQWIGKRAVRTNWATRKPQDENRNTLTFEQVFNSTKSDNTSVYVGNIAQNTTDDSIREAFQRYGDIAEIRMFKAQGYAFVRYEKKEDATKAIMEMNGKEVSGNAVRCSWGRTAQAQTAQTSPLFGDLTGSLLGSSLIPSSPLTAATLPGLTSTASTPYLQYYPQYYGATTLLPQAWPQV